MAAPPRRFAPPRWHVRPREWAQVWVVVLAFTALHFHRCWLFGESFVSTIDMFNQHFPLTIGAVRTWLAGEFPLWCPWRGGGTPWFAATSANLFDPFALWLYLFPNDVGNTLQLASHTVATSLAYYACFRYWRASHRTALMLMILGVWTPNFLGEMPWRVLSAGHWALPLAVMAFDAALRAARPWVGVVGAAVALALALFATQPQIWMYAVLFIAVYGVMWWTLHRTPRAAGRVVGLGAAVAVLWFALAAVQVLPFVEFFRHSNRIAPVAGAQRAQQADLATQDLTPTAGERARTLWADLDTTRRAWAWDGRFWLMRGYRALRAYPGVAPALTVLAVLGVPWGWRRAPVRFAAVVVALSAVGFSTTLGALLTRVIGSLQLQRLELFLPWVFGLLAMGGLDALQSARVPRWGWRRARFPLVVAAGIALTWIMPLRETMPRLARLGIAGNLAPAYFGRVAVELVLFGVVVARLAGWRALTPRRFGRIALSCALLLGVTHAYFSGPPPVRTGPLAARAAVWPNLMDPVRPERLAVLVVQRDPRYYGTDIEENLYQMPMHPNHAVLYDAPFPVVGDYNNLLVETYLEYIDMLNLGERSRGWLNMVGVANPGSPLVDLLGVRYVAGRDDARRAPGGGRYRLVREEPTFPYRHNEDVELPLPLYVVENLHRLPRAFFVSRAAVLPDPDARLQALAAPDFDARRGVILNAPPSAPVAAVAPPGPEPDPLLTPAAVTAYGTNAVTLQVDAPAAGFVVLTDVVFPGWEATVDGNPVGILTAYHTFRAVPVAAGAHAVRFVYRPRPFALGARISGLAWVAVLALGVGAWLRRRPAGAEPASRTG